MEEDGRSVRKYLQGTTFIGVLLVEQLSLVNCSTFCHVIALSVKTFFCACILIAACYLSSIFSSSRGNYMFTCKYTVQ